MGETDRDVITEVKPQSEKVKVKSENIKDKIADERKDPKQKEHVENKPRKTTGGVKSNPRKSTGGVTTVKQYQLNKMETGEADDNKKGSKKQSGDSEAIKSCEDGRKDVAIPSKEADSHEVLSHSVTSQPSAEKVDVKNAKKKKSNAKESLSVKIMNTSKTDCGEKSDNVVDRPSRSTRTPRAKLINYNESPDMPVTKSSKNIDDKAKPSDEQDQKVRKTKADSKASSKVNQAHRKREGESLKNDEVSPLKKPNILTLDDPKQSNKETSGRPVRSLRSKKAVDYNEASPVTQPDGLKKERNKKTL